GIAEPVDDGGDAAPDGRSASARVAVFNLAQPPEQEVHGAFLETIRSGAPRDTPLLVLLDADPYRTRLGGGAAARVAERGRSWERVAREAGLGVAALPAEGDDAL